MRPDTKPFLSLPKAAAALGIPYSTAYDAVRDTGHLLGVKAIEYRGNRKVFSRAQIERVIRGEQDDAPQSLPWDAWR